MRVTRPRGKAGLTSAWLWLYTAGCGCACRDFGDLPGARKGISRSRCSLPP